MLNLEILKKEILDAINKLPESESVVEIMYRLYAIDKYAKVKGPLNVAI